ncbi:MAG: hypothetical protein MK066_02325 [Crocinitomicaceae bacterium]|nr:hypothetical protein [Crocinitomicaceae bacterium]
MVVLLITGIFGATGTYLLAHKGKQGVVRASALLSLVVAILAHLFSNLLPLEYTTQIPVIFIGASFVGMTSPKVIPSIGFMVVSGILFSLLYLWTVTFFNGIGGALGTAACISVISTVTLQNIYTLITHKKRDE